MNVRPYRCVFLGRQFETMAKLRPHDRVIAGRYIGLTVGGVRKIDPAYWRRCLNRVVQVRKERIDYRVKRLLSGQLTANECRRIEVKERARDRRIARKWHSRRKLHLAA